MDMTGFLKSGKIKLNPIDKKVELINTPDFITYDSLNAADWGRIYEKYVGQVFEEEGWKVDYFGLKNGLLDRGIDLLAYKDGIVNAIQCKYVSSVISKNKMEWILYKASKLLDETCSKSPRKTSFTLVVSDVELSFSKKKRKDFILRFSDMSSVEYPVLQYFLDHNYIQDKVKLGFREVRMVR